MGPMTIIDRFTRDRVSRYIWAVLTLGCLLTALFAGQRQATARDNDLWFKLIVIFAALALLCLIMTLLSLRTSERTVSAGVGLGPGGDPVEPRRRGKHALKQAEKAYHFLEAKMKQTQADLEAAEAALVSKEAELSAAQTELEHVRADLQSKSEEAAAAAASAAATTVAMEAASGRDQEHAALTDELTSMKKELAAAKSALEAADAQVAPESALAVMDDAVFAQLEERIVAAEQRARNAEARLPDPHGTLATAADVTKDAEAAVAVGDLRTRLARTAARKKLGADDGPVT